jgi:DNA polymerase-3 subunit delta
VSVHYVKGDDSLLRDAAVHDLVTGLLGADDRTLALEEFVIEVDGRADGDDPDASDEEEEEVTGTPFGAALNAARTPPMMTTKRVVVVRDVGNLASAEVKMLHAYVIDPMPTTELVLVAGGSSRRSPSTSTAVEKLARGAGTVTAPASEKPADVLANEVLSAGLRLEPEASKLVLAHVGGDAGLLPGLVDTLTAVHGEDAELSADDVEPYLTDAGMVPMWDLTNAIERGDIPQALAVLQRLLTVTSPSQPKPLHPLEIMGFLHGHYRRLLRLDDPAIRTNEDAAAALGGRMGAKGAGFRLRQARALGTSGLREAFDQLGRADLDLKGERAIPEDAAMSVLVARLAALTARSTRAKAGRR